MSTTTTLLPFHPESMTPAQLAAVSYLARYAGQTHLLYAYQLRRWFAWCESNGLDALIGVQRARVELYVRHRRECGLRDSSICTMMHGVRGLLPVRAHRWPHRRGPCRVRAASERPG